MASSCSKSVMLARLLLLLLLLLFLLIFMAASPQEAAAADEEEEEEAMKPVGASPPRRRQQQLLLLQSKLVSESQRRKLGSFQICALCTCCGGPKGGLCLPSPCCYSINCNIPNRPFGFCAFTPKTCNCFRCHL